MTVRSLFGLFAVLAMSPLAAAQTGDGPWDAISREVTVNVSGGSEAQDAISREITVNAQVEDQGPWDAIGREITVYSPTANLVFDPNAVALPDWGNAEEVFEVRWRVANTGSITALGPWNDRITFSVAIQAVGGGSSTTFDFPGPSMLFANTAYERVQQFVMPAIPPAPDGTFTISLSTDVTGSVIEDPSEDDNTYPADTPHVVTVIDIPRPDLGAVVTQHPASLVAGDFATLAFRVCNTGSFSTSAQWIDRVFLVRDVDMDGLPPSSESGAVASWSYPNLLPLDPDPAACDGGVPNTSYERTATGTIQIPASAEGMYFLAVRTDAGGAQIESNETNNLAWSTVFTVTEPPRPDLQVASVGLLDAAPGTPIESGTFHIVQWDVSNLGPATFSGGGVTTQVWVSIDSNTDATAFDQAIQLASFGDSVPALGIGGSSMRSKQVFVPADLPLALDSMGGPYFFKVRLDPSDAIAELETVGAPPHWNNLAVGGDHPVSLSSTPDLFAEHVELAAGQGTPQVAHTMQVEFEVQNLGLPGWNIPLTWRDRVWLSLGDTTIGTGDVVLGTYSESTVLLSGEWGIPPDYTRLITVVVPSSLAAGSYHLILETDYDDAVFEYVSTGDAPNEVASAAFQIEREPADLFIAAQAPGGATLPPTEGAPGQSITLPWTVTNDAGAGTTSVSSWTDRVYLSQDPNALVGAVTVLTRAHSGALAPGESYSEVRTASVPLVDPAQTWYLYFRTDVNGAVFEDGASANNHTSTPFDVTDAVADLRVTALNATPRMTPGDPVAVSWTVENPTAVATLASSWTDRVYLSDTMDIGQANELVVLGGVQRSAALGAGATYNAGGMFTVPQELEVGFWYVVVETDANHQVFEIDETNNTRSTRSLLEITPPPPANLVVSDVTILNSPVTAGQAVDLEWTVTNAGAGPTDVASWSDSVYLSLDDGLDALDPYLGYHTHPSSLGGLGAGESRVVARSYVVPLGQNTTWKVIVKTNSNGAVYQAGQTFDDVIASAGLLEVQTPPLTDLLCTAANLPTSQLLGEVLAFDWTTLNNSMTTIPASWSWSDQVWLMPDGEGFPSPNAVLMGQLMNEAGELTMGAMHVQANGTLTVPGVAPGPYRLVVLTDALDQIAELFENTNTHVSTSTVDLQAIPINLGGAALADLASGSSRWFRLTAAPDKTVDLELVHDDAGARCELYVREGAPPSLGVYDFASEGIGAVDPHVQTARIPRTSGADYFVLARTVDGAGMASGATLNAIERPFGVAEVEPQAVGAGVVTIAIDGYELWRASSVELRDASPGAGVESSLEHVLLPDGTLLARFDLSGAALGDREVVVVDGTTMSEVQWSGLLAVDSPVAPALSIGLDASPSVRRGEAGAATLTLTNQGNVDLPYATATLGHGRAAAVVNDDERVVISGSETNGTDDSLVIVVEDLRPGGEHALALTLEVGASYDGDDAAFAVACLPATSPEFLGGLFAELSERLRLALVADQDTPASISGVVQDPLAWSQLVDAAVISGAIPVNLTTIHTPSSAARSARDLAQAIADGVAIQFPLPAGQSLPGTALDPCCDDSGCAPFTSTALDCAALFPTVCGGETASVSVTTQAGGNVPTGVACVATPAPDDPNEKSPPPGTGTQGIVNGGEPLRYEVHFENQASATAWASRVEITDALDAGFRSSSVRFEELRIGRTTIAFPPGTSSYLGQVLLQLDDETETLCQISTGVDALSDTIFVVLQALDPTSGLPPSSGDEGLLPPNGEGLEDMSTGYIAFNVTPDPLADPAAGLPSVSARRMKNMADIRFNAQVPLPTNQTENTLDGGPPVSELFLGPVVGKDIALSWSASDEESLPGGPFPGSGVDRYSLHVGPSDAGPWTPVVTDTQATSHAFVGTYGATHFFKVEATDRVGIAEHKPTADLSVALPDDCNGNDVPDDVDISMGTSQDANGNGVPDECECVVTTYCVATLNSTGQPASIAGSGTPSLSTGSLTLSASNLPSGESAMFLYGTQPAQVPFGDGFRCVQGQMARLKPVMITGAAGTASLALDLQDPQVTLTAGDTGHFQLWYRDAAAGGAGFNLSDGLAVTFCD